MTARRTCVTVPVRRPRAPSPSGGADAFVYPYSWTPDASGDGSFDVDGAVLTLTPRSDFSGEVRGRSVLLFVSRPAPRCVAGVVAFVPGGGGLKVPIN